jgi:hypothetical protein
LHKPFAAVSSETAVFYSPEYSHRISSAQAGIVFSQKVPQKIKILFFA